MEALEDRTTPAGFSFPDFAAPAGLTLLGDADLTPDHRLRLTPAEGGKNGAAWFTAEKQFVGLAFDTTFQFQLTGYENSPSGGSDGFVFLLQNTTPTYLAGGGGTLGYDGLRNSLAVEFDTWQNSEVNDPSPSHISVHTNGTGSNGWSEALSLGSYNTSPTVLDDSAVHTARITYTPGTLAVYLDNLTTPKLTVPVDLAEKLGLDAGKAWVGFTAATGGGWQNHDILNWTYSILPDVTTTLSIDDASAVEGSAGPVGVTFTVTRSGDTSGTATVNWATEDRSATAGSDYTAASGQVTFGPGQTQQTVTVTAAGDGASEPHETFVVRLTGAAGASIADGVGVGTVLNDDVTISVDDATAIEGDETFRYIDAFVSADSGGLANPHEVVFGPDGFLYVASGNTDQVLRYDAQTGAFVDVAFAHGDAGVVLDTPWAMAFGPDGRLYVGGRRSDNVLRYDPAMGTVEEYIAAGGAVRAPAGLTFGSDGLLYVANSDFGPTDDSPLQDQVVRFQGPAGGSPGQFVDVFVARGDNGLDSPNGLLFDGDVLYVCNTRGDSVHRYDRATGAFQGVFVAQNSGGLDTPSHLAVRSGYLYVTSQSTRQLLRYNAADGGFVDAPAAPVSGGFAFDQSGNVYGGNVSTASASGILRYGPASQAVFTVRLSNPSASPVSVSFATADGTAVAGADYLAANGTITFAPGQTARTVLVQTIDDATAESPEAFTLTLSNPVGGVIADGQATATITEDEATKFYVVDDAADRTYRYGATGKTLPDTSLGNTAPRGAASTAAGDRVWVVDANLRVYVYDAGGILLGSWAVGSLPKGGASPEGISTDGTDVWIVDDKSDRVYRYVNAASRLSGSQNAAGSFALDRSNRYPRGITTDGTSLWVVNDAYMDLVFKYSPAGSLLGSWRMTGGGESPTGITLDPSNPNHLWVADTATDRVYQYDAAVGRTTGSQAASGSFALAAGNTNPQGIADPPAPGTGVPIGPAISMTWDPVTGEDPRPEPAAPPALPATRSEPAPLADDLTLGTDPSGIEPAPVSHPVPVGVSVDWAAADEFDLTPVVVG
jgi:hypothetical protein